MRKMRRSDRQMPLEEAANILKNGEYGILSTVDDENQPYGTPMSYVYTDDKIYFHCATQGQKIDNMLNNPKVCFSVVGQTTLLPEQFATNYESVMAFGTSSIVAEDDEKIFALKLIIDKYSAGFMKEGIEYIERAKDHTLVVRIDIKNLTGKHRV